MSSPKHLCTLTEPVEQLKQVLEGLYTKWNRAESISPDPLQFVYKYSDFADREVAGFLSAALAYGRVQQIEKSLTDLFGRMGKGPYAFVRNFGQAERGRLSGFKHRFTTGRDIADLFQVLRRVLNEKGTMEDYFLQGYSETDKNIIPALSKFIESLLEMGSRQRGVPISRGLKYLLACPSLGSACKRLNLFLRWMVRKDEVDPGLWRSIDKAKLIVPVDIHMSRLCKILGLSNRKTISLATAVTITQGFAEMEPADPVKYDFALSRIGIVDNCNGMYRPQCTTCELATYCSDR